MLLLLMAKPSIYTVQYNNETKMFFDSVLHPLPIWYPYIDFILLLDKLDNDESEDELEIQGKNQLFVRKGIAFDERYFVGTYNPVVRNLVSIVKSLLIS